MKIRQGFVSNSSSSSFVILMTEDQYKELHEKVDVNQKALMEELKTEVKAFGLDLIQMAGCEGNYSIFEEMEIADDELEEDEFEEKYGYEMYASEAWYNISWPKDIIQVDVEC